MKTQSNFSKKLLSERDFKALSGLWKIDRVILDTLDYEQLAQKVVNSILTELDYLKLGYEIIVLTLTNQQKGIMERISISKTQAAEKALQETPIPFSKIEVPLTAEENLLVMAANNKKIYVTKDLSDVLFPAGNRDTWRDIQKVCGIKTSVVYPIISRNRSLGSMIFSLSKNENEISDQEWEVLAGFTNAVGIALENASLYKRLHLANQKLKDLDKQKDEFISVAAHELRAPMTAIKGFLSMIMEGDAGKVNDKVKDYLSEAVQGNDRLIRLVNNMLNVARIEEGRMVYKMGNVNLSKATQTVFKEYELEAQKKGLKISLNIPSGLMDRVYVDQDRIHEVISNLVSNAVKYTDKGFVSINLSQPDKQTVKLEVKDTGLGISQEEQKKLFEKFTQTSSGAGKQMGSGLGLYITKLLVEKFGGKLGLESETAKGTAFWFELPLSS